MALSSSITAAPSLPFTLGWDSEATAAALPLPVLVYGQSPEDILDPTSAPGRGAKVRGHGPAPGAGTFPKEKNGCVHSVSHSNFRIVIFLLNFFHFTSFKMKTWVL